MHNRLLVSFSLALLFMLACGLIPTAVENTPEPVPAIETQSPDQPPQQQADISGDYTIQGTNPNGTSYTGEANITGTGDGYTIRWVIAGDSMHGLGKFDGQTFRVNWEASWGTGEALYTLNTDGSLSGTWTMDGGSGQGLETLTPK